ncbi:hypothetical protein DL96DRAFT_278004 [Flagelloscypha sp. PMI_526]|nr:hypothetical protein DL96DRAFT_278004 [Flagelloscypha sp. PMI_526]
MPAMIQFPLSVLQLLVSFSASCDIPTARALSLVSDNFQRWADIYLFSSLSETNCTEKSLVQLLDQMCNESASPRLIRAKQYVRSLAWLPLPGPSNPFVSKIPRYLPHFPNLVQLCVWNGYLPELMARDPRLFDPQKSFPNLKRLHTCSFSASTLPRSGFQYPFWSTITHLQLELQYPIHDRESPFIKPLFTSLTQLTHLALGNPGRCFCPDGPERALKMVISRVQLAFPPSLILCLLNFGKELFADETQTQINALLSGETDHRIVLWSMPQFEGDDRVVSVESHGDDAFKVWCDLPDSQVTFWEAGEAVQRKRGAKTCS